MHSYRGISMSAFKYGIFDSIWRKNDTSNVMQYATCVYIYNVNIYIYIFALDISAPMQIL